jgi:IS1 family transposase
MFTQPPCCPNPDCARHTDGAKGFYERRGTFRTKHDRRRVPRYRCKTCGRWFNSRTFNATAGQHRPEVNRPILDMICSGMSMRRVARVLCVAKTTVEARVRWLADQSRKAHDRFLAAPPEKTSYVQIDELETYEHSSLKPLSIALAVRAKTGQIIDARVASMNCHGVMASISRKFYGKRADTRKEAFAQVLGSVGKVAKPKVTIATDARCVYRPLIKEVIPGAVHKAHVQPKKKGRLAAKTSILKRWDPLYRLNQTAAKLRADISRLARKTWSASKRAARLQDHLAIYIAFNNGYELVL